MSLTPGQEIVAPFREEHEVDAASIIHRTMLDQIATLIDRRCAILEENASSARGAALISLNRAKAAESLAEERMKAFLAAAAFGAMLSTELDRAHARADRLTVILRAAADLAHGLRCAACGQGRAMAAKCCRDVDCDAGWYGISADEVKAFLEAVDSVMPGTLADLEAEPVAEPVGAGGADA